MIPKIWYVSDVKINKDNKDKIIEQWNNQVHEEDYVWCIGSPFEGEHNPELLSQLNGQKVLIGTYNDEQNEGYINFFLDAVDVGSFIISINPIMLPTKGNLHGGVSIRSPKFWNVNYQNLGRLTGYPELYSWIGAFNKRKDLM
jgi:hypothetical protein